MFQLPTWNDKKCAILKGSEFRTAISLANFGAFWEGRHGSHFFRPMNNSFKKSSRHSHHCHRRAMRAP
jgi:hypothetical protein